MIQLNEPIARFTGIQPGFDDIKPYELWTLNRPIPQHPAGSTLCRETIEEYGYTLPANPLHRFRSGTKCTSLELGTIMAEFPAVLYTSHPVADLRTAYAWGYANRLWPIREAMRILFRANMEWRESSGHGNKAARRWLALTDVRTQEAARLGLSMRDYAAYERDMDEMAREQAKQDTLVHFERRERAQVPQEAPL